MRWKILENLFKSVYYKKEKPKGVGNSITLAQNITNIDKIEEIILALTEQVTYRLRKYDLLANTVSVQLRTDDFKDKTHQGKLICPTSSTKEIYMRAKELVEEMYLSTVPIRLIGLRVDNLEEKENAQLSLFNNNEANKQEKLDTAIDKIKEKYGYHSITRAGKLETDKLLKLKDIKG